MYSKINNLLSELSAIARENKSEHEKETQKFYYADKYDSSLKFGSVYSFFSNLAKFDGLALKATETSSAESKLYAAIGLRTLYDKACSILKDTLLISDDDKMIELNKRANEAIKEYYAKFEKYYVQVGVRKFEQRNPLREQDYWQDLEKTPNGRKALKSLKKCGKIKEYWRNLPTKSFKPKHFIGILTGLVSSGALTLVTLKGGAFNEGEGLAASIVVGLPLGYLVGYLIGIPFTSLIRKVRLNKAKRLIDFYKKEYDSIKIPRMQDFDEKCRAFFVEKGITEDSVDLKTFNKNWSRILKLFEELEREIAKARYIDGLQGYSSSELLSISRYLANGRADSIKEAVNLYENDRRFKEAIQAIQESQARQNAARNAEIKEILSGLTVAINADRRKKEEIIEEQKKRNALLKEIADEETRQTNIINRL